jgi:hypothetical protein
MLTYSVFNFIILDQMSPGHSCLSLSEALHVKPSKEKKREKNN